MPGPNETLAKAKTIKAGQPRRAEITTAALEGLTGALGLSGFLPGKQTRAGTAGELLTAGLPFAQLGALRGLRKIAGKPTVFHGTPEVFDKFHLAANNPHDTLGWMVHAAEQPGVADSYTSSFPHGTSLKPPKLGKRIIPITSSSENVLDITQIPTGDDWEAVKAALRINAKDPRFRQSRYPIDELIGLYDEAKTGQAVNSGPLVYMGGPAGWLKEVRTAFNNPNAMEAAGFDAIRYLDFSAPSWAFAKPEQLTTPWGVPLGSKAAIPPAEIVLTKRR